MSWLGWFTNDRAKSELASSDLAQTLLTLSNGTQDCWTIGDSFSGCLILGATGSGKTSGPGAAIRRAMLSHGYGVLALTVKVDDRDDWQRLCEQTGRSKDLIVFGPDQPHRFNPFEYERRRLEGQPGLVESLVNLFATVVEAASADSVKANDAFWRKAVARMLRNAFGLLIHANEPLTLENVNRLLLSAPRYPEQVDDPIWMHTSYLVDCIGAACHNTRGTPRQFDNDSIGRYWVRQLPTEDDRTRANIEQSYYAAADGFCQGALRELFQTGVTLVPEHITQAGKVVLIDLPTKVYGDFGRQAQVLWKYVVQRAIERRDIDQHGLPVAIVADEAQEFFVMEDLNYQATARSGRAATVYMTQNINGFMARLGGAAHAKAVTESLFGNLATRFVLANADPDTNEFIERTIGKSWAYHANTSVQSGSPASGAQNNSANSHSSGVHSSGVHSSGVSSSLDSQVLASQFLTLRTGGQSNHYLVDAMVSQAGRVWSNGKTYLFTTFKQG